MVAVQITRRVDHTVHHQQQQQGEEEDDDDEEEAEEGEEEQGPGQISLGAPSLAPTVLPSAGGI